jgi:hypothetical protein
VLKVLWSFFLLLLFVIQKGKGFCELKFEVEMEPFHTNCPRTGKLVCTCDFLGKTYCPSMDPSVTRSLSNPYATSSGPVMGGILPIYTSQTVKGIRLLGSLVAEKASSKFLRRMLGREMRRARVEALRERVRQIRRDMDTTSRLKILDCLSDHVHAKWDEMEYEKKEMEIGAREEQTRRLASDRILRRKKSETNGSQQPSVPQQPRQQPAMAYLQRQQQAQMQFSLFTRPMKDRLSSIGVSHPTSAVASPMILSALRSAPPQVAPPGSVGTTPSAALASTSRGTSWDLLLNELLHRHGKTIEEVEGGREKKK